jgi:hypothetical protein
MPGDDDDVAYELQRARARARLRGQRLRQQVARDPDMDMAFVAVLFGEFDAAEVEQSCHELQAALVTHYNQVRRQIGWARLERAFRP